MLFRKVFQNIFSKKTTIGYGLAPASPSLSLASKYSSCSNTPSDFSPTTACRCLRRMCLPDLDILKLLSNGSCSKVYLVRDKLKDELLALKVISKRNRSKEFMDNIAREQLILRELVTDDQFGSLVASWHDEENCYLAMTYFPGGDMALEMLRCRTFDEDRVRFYAASMVTILATLHKKHIIHRDIKPSNILFRPDGHLVLIDFGLSKMFAETCDFDFDSLYNCFNIDSSADSGSFLKPKTELTYVTNEVCGTSFYMAPEQYYGQDYSFDVDFWGMGVTLYRMLTNRMPFGDTARTNSEMARCVSNDCLIFLPEDNVLPITQNFLQGLLAKDRRDRLRLDQIKSHPYFRDIDWNAMTYRKVEAPWKPYVPPAPLHARSDIDIVEGLPITQDEDPYPWFTFYSDAARVEYARRTTSNSYTPPKPKSKFSFIKFFKNMFSFGSAETCASAAKASPSRFFALRPLQLPKEVISRETKTKTKLLSRGDLSPTQFSEKSRWSDTTFAEAQAKLWKERNSIVHRVKAWVYAVWKKVAASNEIQHTGLRVII